MASRSCIDTSVLIYAEARDAPAKQRASLNLLRQLLEDATGVLSTQVLQEYCNVALKKLKLPAHHVRAQLDVFEQFEQFEQFEVIQITPAIIRIGLDLHQTRSLAFFDTIIVASAQTAGCAGLLSKVLNTGEIMAGVRMVNPFANLPPV